jgi:cobalt-zinc-cadmium efflux system membrane fusion protein
MKYILILSIIINVSLFAQDGKSEIHHDELKISPDLFDEIGISFTSIKRMSLDKQIKVYGEIIPTVDGYSIVGTLISGRISKVYVNLGDEVKKGQVLFEISSLEVMEIIDQYFSSQAELKRAQNAYERLKKLRNENIGSEKNFFDAESAFEKSKAEFESNDRKIHALGFTDSELKELTISKKHHSTAMSIKAPISGRIDHLTVKRGQFVSGEEILAEILDSKKLWARVHIYETDAIKIKKDMDVLLYSSTNPDTKSSGKVLNISQSLMRDKKSVEAIVSLESSKNFILGSNITANIQSSLGQKLFVLPSEAVIKDNEGSFVFVRESSDSFEKRKVITGKEVDGFIQIRNGLNVNESVVEKGSFYLKSLSKGEELGGHHD